MGTALKRFYEQGPPGWVFGAVTVGVILGVVIAAAVGIGKALELCIQAQGLLIGLPAAVSGPWFWYKASKRSSQAKVDRAEIASNAAVSVNTDQDPGDPP